MRVLTSRLPASMAVAFSVAMSVALLSGCGARQDGSGGLPVLSFPRTGAAPRQTEPDLSSTPAGASARANTGANTDAGDGQAPLPADSFLDPVQFDEP